MLTQKTGTIPCEICRLKQGHQETSLRADSRKSVNSKGNRRQTRRLPHKNAGDQKTGEMATIQRDLLASMRTCGWTSLRKHPFLHALRCWWRSEEKRMFSQAMNEPDSDQIVQGTNKKKMRKVWFQKCNSSSYQFKWKICLASCIHSFAHACKKRRKSSLLEETSPKFAGRIHEFLSVNPIITPLKFVLCWNQSEWTG